MTILPCRSDFLIDYQYFHQLLLGAREYCCQNNTSKIVSISLEIDLVDPLAVLEKFSATKTINFYFEHREKGEAIVAIDAISQLEISGQDRFIQAEKFIKSCISKIINLHYPDRAISIPRFFCAFSFFNQNIKLDYPFPAATVFLPRLQVVLKNKRCLLVMNTILDAQTNISQVLQALQNQIKLCKSLDLVSYSYSDRVDEFPEKISQKLVNNQHKFQDSVKLVLEKIHAHHLSKIVLADALDVVSSHNFNIFKSLNNLRQLHPSCFIFCLSNGQGQHFLGASPERLISIHQHQLITDALAGSAPRGETPEQDTANANSLVNSSKEKHEHQLVLDFITQRLEQIGLFPQVLSPRLRQLSNIQHLWTPIRAVVPTHIHPLRIVAQLHPTPAVAGAARDFACAEIRRYENFERGLYASPLGWVDAEANCEFIVGIRSALIDGDRARLYAGAGIVAGSHPEREFAEVQWKLQALLKALV
jgi:menaquinone-specific isochorismate synthase